MGWKNESRRHSLARKGVKTQSTQAIQNVRMDESSGVWFESEGVLGDMVSLVQIMGFDDLLANKQAKGIAKDQYTIDASKIIVYPSVETAKSIDWMKDEYKAGNNRRKSEIKKMSDIAKKQVEYKIRTSRNVDVRLDLHKSWRMLDDFNKELYRGA